jgi:hypothetical protein
VLSVAAAPAVAAAAATIGLIYLGGDLTTKYITGKSLGDFLNDYTDKKGVSIEGGTLFKW